jgi:hypothetical protein
MAPSQSRTWSPPPNIGQKFPGHQYILDNTDKTPVKLEDLCLIENHLQCHRMGQTYIYSPDTTPEGLARTWMQEKQFETPCSTYEQIKVMGV